MRPAATDEAWETFREQVRAACAALAGKAGAATVEVNPFGSERAQILAAPERRNLQRSPEQRVPRIGDPRKPKTVCKMSIVGGR